MPIIIANPCASLTSIIGRGFVVPSVSYGDFSESQLATRVAALLRMAPAALNSTNCKIKGDKDTSYYSELRPFALFHGV